MGVIRQLYGFYGIDWRSIFNTNRAQNGEEVGYMIPGRLMALIVKEFLALLRDPKSRMVLVLPPLLQLLIFSYAATLEVKNVKLLILNEDLGVHSSQLIQRLKGSPTFVELAFVNHIGEIKPYIDEQRVLAALHIPQYFSRDLEAGQPTNLQVVLDGRRSNAAQIVNGYLATVINGYATELQTKFEVTAQPVGVLSRNWFNPNLIYLWFTIPSLVGILAGLISLMITALSVARERELGTFEQLLVSPLMAHEILIGKTIPAVIIGLAEGLVMFLAARLIFAVPFTGSLLLFFVSTLVFALAVVGVGLFISAFSKTQQQAILGAFIFLVPAIALSGYAAPIDNMPQWLQIGVEANPVKHFLIIAKGLFLKDMPAIQVWQNLWPMLIIATVTLSVSGWMFKQNLE